MILVIELSYPRDIADHPRENVRYCGAVVKKDWDPQGTEPLKEVAARLARDHRVFPLDPWQFKVENCYVEKSPPPTK